MQIDIPTKLEQNDSSQLTPAGTVQYASLAEIPAGDPRGPSLLGSNLQLIQGVKIKLSVRVGEAEISVGELFALKEGSVIKLDRRTHEPIDILLDGKIIARGKLVVTDDNFGVSITEIPQAPAQ